MENKTPNEDEIKKTVEQIYDWLTKQDIELALGMTAIARILGALAAHHSVDIEQVTACVKDCHAAVQETLRKTDKNKEVVIES
jgi:hypothetical protein